MTGVGWCKWENGKAYGRRWTVIHKLFIVWFWFDVYTMNYAVIQSVSVIRGSQLGCVGWGWCGEAELLLTSSTSFFSAFVFEWKVVFLSAFKWGKFIEIYANAWRVKLKTNTICHVIIFLFSFVEKWKCKTRGKYSKTNGEQFQFFFTSPASALPSTFQTTSRCLLWCMSLPYCYSATRLHNVLFSYSLMPGYSSW